MVRANPANDTTRPRMAGEAPLRWSPPASFGARCWNLLQLGIGFLCRLRLCYHNRDLAETTGGTAVDILLGYEHSNAFFTVPFLDLRRSRS
ncbi:hypothetical protein VN12_17530 [Pirellula sp. SH-Sr6A]|nr:hypothetical protein VN12_17530 [Pirellula sp. SH-Sr6A]